MYWKIKLVTLWITVVGCISFAQAESTSKLLRFPDIHLGKIVFTYAGDLWLVSSEGGLASRLTSHPGLEMFAKFSPDGKWIAFTGQYTGEEQIFVIPAHGGIPRQLTFYPARGPLPPRWGYDNQVYGWHPSGEKVLFRSSRDSWDFAASRLYTVPRSGGMPEVLSMPQAGSGSFSPNGKKVFYSPLFRDFRTWKRYQGGWAQDLYIFDLSGKKTRQITRHIRTDRDPMWVGEKLCFSSDRDGRLNLFCHQIDKDKTSQLTFHKDWDVRWPSDGPDGQVVYELKGQLRVFDTHTNRDTTISIEVPTDAVPAQPRWVSAADHIESFNLSPHGKRVLFVARGDIFDAPSEHGLTRNLTHSSDAHDREAQMSPDGKKVVFISDRSGEEELWLLDLQAQDARQLTRGSRNRLYDPRWSPNGKHIAYSDSQGRIMVLRFKNLKSVQAAHEQYGRCEVYNWSPHGGHLAFSLQDSNQNRSLYIWSVDGQKLRRITSADFSEHEPVWDPKGDYLYYLSLRDFRPQMGGLDFNFVVNRATGIYALALRKDLPHPYPPRNDTEASPDKKKGGDKKEKKDEDDNKWSFEKIAKADAVKIDFDGLADRVAKLPIAGDNYGSLRVTATKVIFLRRGPWYHGRADIKPKLEAFDMKKRESKVLSADVSDYALAWDGMTVLARSDNKYKLIKLDGKGAPTGNSGKDKTKTVSTEGLRVRIDPRMEWKNIFDEIWRRFRDYFYVENMHGYDWQGLGRQYRSLLPHVGHRSDLNYLVGEMISELNVSHAYIQGGDLSLPKRPPAALPGARFELDPKVGKYRIEKIFKGHNQEDTYRAPLTEVGVDARVGDYILAINGHELRANDNPYQLLRLKTDLPVELTLNQKPNQVGARRVVIQPRGEEHNLLYLAWVEENRRKVDKATGGRVGYIHIPDMMSNGVREFIKWFYPQTRKQGLIVDVRSNGGGHVSQLLIERLRRKLLMTDFGRHYEVTTYPSYVLHGPMVCLINETSASDGDIFPWAFRKAEIGSLIGKRTWGGVVGITYHGPLLDGGNVFVPEFSNNDANGNFIIEGRGVEPDIELDNDPISVLQGKDRQLDRAIQEVKRRMQETPMNLPKRKPAPIKNQR